LRGIPLDALAPTMVEEMRTFKTTLTPEGHDQSAAWREREHAAIVLAGGVAVWFASTRKRWCVVL
jgi:hypothetical protein